MVPWVVLVSALVVSAAAEVVLSLVAAAEVLRVPRQLPGSDCESGRAPNAEELELVPLLPPQAAGKPRNLPAMVGTEQQ